MASNVCRALFKPLYKGQQSVENEWKHRLWKLINGESLGGLVELWQRGAGLVTPACAEEHPNIWQRLIGDSSCGTLQDKCFSP